MTWHRVVRSLFVFIFSNLVLAAAEPIAPAQYAFNLDTSVKSYEAVGRTNSTWDSVARRAMTNFALLRSWTNGAPIQPLRNLQADLVTLAALKCTDPFIRYLQLRFAPEADQAKPAYATEFKAVAEALEKSDYPAIRKSYAHLWAYRLSKQGEGDADLLRLAALRLGEALNSKSMPISEADQACDRLLTTGWWANGKISQLYSELEPALTRHWSNTFVGLLARGRAHLSRGWEARGNGSASTVSAQAFSKFRQELDQAARALEAAWNLKEDARVCLEMMRVELGQNQGRARLELWFDRGMKLTPDNYALCSQKLEYLRPRWYGSIEEMVSFGRECMAKPQWSGSVLLMAADAHYEASREIQEEKARVTYWKRAEVWADIRNAFEAFFARYPNEVGYRHNYARYAVWCGQWRVADAQFRLFPSTNYAYFGGVEQFQQMARTAAAVAAAPAKPSVTR